MTEDDKRNCCLVEIQETEAKYYKTLEDIEKVSVCAECAVHLCRSVLMKVRFCPGTSFPIVTSFLLVSQACGLGHSMEMSAIGRFIGEHKCHSSWSILLLMAQPQQETRSPGALNIGPTHHRHKDTHRHMHIGNKCLGSYLKNGNKMLIYLNIQNINLKNIFLVINILTSYWCSVHMPYANSSSCIIAVISLDFFQHRCL